MGTQKQINPRLLGLPEKDKKELQTMYWRTKNLIDVLFNADRQDREAKELRDSVTLQQVTNFSQFITQCEYVGVQHLERVLN